LGAEQVAEGVDSKYEESIKVWWIS